MAVIFSSDLADAETGYLAMLAALVADHKKLARTQILVRLGAASQQEEEDVTATTPRTRRMCGRHSKG
jgi:hypothetical protein